MGSLEVFFRALVNDHFRQPVLPSVFERVMGKDAAQVNTPDDFLKNLLPTTKDLQEVQANCVEDKKIIEHLLEADGQQALKADPISVEFSSINHEQLSRSEDHTSELQSLMRISYAVFCLK